MSKESEFELDEFLDDDSDLEEISKYINVFFVMVGIYILKLDDGCVVRFFFQVILYLDKEFNDNRIFIGVKVLLDNILNVLNYLKGLKFNYLIQNKEVLLFVFYVKYINI